MHVSNVQEELNNKAQELAKKFIAYAIGDDEAAKEIGEKEGKVLHSAVTTFIFGRLKDKTVKDPSISVDEPIRGVLPVSKDNIEIVSFVRDKIIGGLEFPAGVKEAARQAREQALADRGDLKKDLKDEIAALAKTRKVANESAPEYQQRYDQNKLVLELFGVKTFDLQKLKEAYAYQHGGGPTVKNGQDFANILDNVVFHIREGKIDSKSMRELGLTEAQTKEIAEKLSEKLKAISEAKLEDRANAAVAYLKSYLPEFDVDKFKKLNGEEYAAKVHKIGLSVLKGNDVLDTKLLLDFGFNEAEIAILNKVATHHKPGDLLEAPSVTPVQTDVSMLGATSEMAVKKGAAEGKGGETWQL